MRLSDCAIYLFARSIVLYSSSGLSGVDSFDVSLEKQEVIVRGSAAYDDVLATIKKTGKEVRIAPSYRDDCVCDADRSFVDITGPIWRSPPVDSVLRPNYMY